MQKSLVVLALSSLVLWGCNDEGTDDNVVNSALDLVSNVTLPSATYEITADDADRLVKVKNNPVDVQDYLEDSLYSSGNCDSGSVTASQSSDDINKNTGAVSENGKATFVSNYQQCESYNSILGMKVTSTGMMKGDFVWEGFSEANGAFEKWSLKLAIENLNYVYNEVVNGSNAERANHYEGVIALLSKSNQTAEFAYRLAISTPDTNGETLIVTTTAATVLDMGTQRVTGGLITVTGANGTNAELRYVSNGVEVSINGVYVKTVSIGE